MYWINLAALEREMVDDHYNEKKAFNYFLAYFILNALNFAGNYKIEGLFKLTVIPVVIITICGCYAIFNVYKKHDGKDFFSRFWGLNWVIGFRLILFFVPLSLTLGPLSLYIISNNIIKESFIPNRNWYEIVFTLLFLIIFYLQLYRSFRRVAKHQPLK